MGMFAAVVEGTVREGGGILFCFRAGAHTHVHAHLLTLLGSSLDRGQQDARSNCSK